RASQGVTLKRRILLRIGRVRGGLCLAGMHSESRRTRSPRIATVYHKRFRKTWSSSGRVAGNLPALPA
ncbi:MAG TPA: hypothetical protein VFI76_05460, partial [Terrimicrobiaceae bacterium]|nr:hypothetical protein [Terrimicrobiaceae bacterium]